MRRPVIVTDGGSTDDFVPAECGWRSRPGGCRYPDGRCRRSRPAGEGFLLEPDPEALVAALRDAADPVRRAAQGCARPRPAERFTWERAGVWPLRRSSRCASPADPFGRRHRRARPARASSSSSPPTGPARDVGRPLRAYAEAFGPATTRRSSFRRSTRRAALALASAELEAGGYDLETLADICIADRSATVTEALELAADAMICANGYRPTRAGS